jgi:diguanylate cyclase (GGDEF)-like protein
MKFVPPTQFDSSLPSAIAHEPTRPATVLPPQEVLETHGSLRRLVLPFVLAITLLAAFSFVSLEALMALRAYGSGENNWVKSQKTAAYQLMRYAQTGSRESLEQHDAAMARLAHFRNGRLHMLERPPDDEAATRELEAAGSPRADIAHGLWANRWFGWSSRFQEILDLWAQADAIILELRPLRDSVMAAHARNDQAALVGLYREIDRIDFAVMPVSAAFGTGLANTTRSVYAGLLNIGFVLTVCLVLGIVWRTHGLWSASQKAQRQLASERRRAAITLASIGDAVVTTDERGAVTYMNHAAQRLCQRPLDGDGVPDQGPSAPPGRPKAPKATSGGSERSELGGPLHLEDPATRREILPAVLAMANLDALPVQSDGDHWLRRPDGSKVPVAWVSSPIIDQGHTSGAVVVLRDTTRERQMVQRLSWMATHDPLTRLPNRREFEWRLRSALQRLRGDEDHDGAHQQHVAMLVDLDQFKIVNDTCGHAAGDELLRMVAHAARKILREQDTLARMGGDEFGVLLLNCPPSVGERKADELRAAIGAVHLDWGGRLFDISASLGLVHVRREDQDVSAILSAADVACYVAKDRGRNQVSVFHPGDRSFAERFGDMTWPQRLRGAMSQGRFMLYQQPLMGLKAGDRSRRCEILLRLRDEHDQLVPPSTFIPAAERYGLMPQIDRWVVDQSLRTIACRAAHEQATIYNINLSGSSFGDESFLVEVQAMFEAHGVRYEQVCFEVTETQAIADVAAASRFIGVLRSRGASFALDDFGSGMSSMTYLKHLPVDYLKIDGKLVKDMVTDPVNRAMVEMVSRLAQALGMRTVGEFAEDPKIIEALRGVGVDYAQGYGVARPMPFSASAANDTGEPRLVTA